ALFLNIKGGGRQVTYTSSADGNISPWIASAVTGEATVLETKTMQTVWKASVKVSHETPVPFGNGISSMVDDATSKLAAKLAADKVIPEKP
ncbi:MAG TPA: hypothetical protein VJ550_03645, partial [Geomonas sp.]|nr:hypothetical protein [Geomonas sp.]